MNLTDLIRGEDFHRLSHKQQTDEENAARIKRIKEAYGGPVQKCVTECGTVTGDPIMEFSFILSILAILDHCIEQSTSGLKN